MSGAQQLHIWSVGLQTHMHSIALLMQALKPGILVECLTPDFRGDLEAVRHLARWVMCY